MNEVEKCNFFFFFSWSAIKKNPEKRILFLFHFAENKVGGSVNQKIKKVWPKAKMVQKIVEKVHKEIF